MYTLYYSPSTASLAVHWMLVHLEVPFELVLVDFGTKAQRSPEYLKVNPAGYVPALIVDGKPHAECAALLLLLAERHPEAHLDVPAGSAERADYLQGFFFLANTLQPAFRAWFYAGEVAGSANVEAARDHAREKIEDSFERLDAQFADGRAFMTGNRMTAVDFLLTMLARWSRNMPRPATQYSNLLPYINRMRTLPSLRQVHARENLSDWING